ncbi:C4-dicarboxylate transporter, DctQ subunit [Desulfotomaculum arcticum]|uniref:C4-dicarboxylate transporter, DctQ subunit n=1 Tax=Desulfotruncus arcticus DSM 17038 TaxID=1121424 RepID=A0A1I2S3Y5_9FIRM|nr:TRAP transporter small permease [Desulfotruncus arcticus]SFG47470.1 C4-dicarboxylate transporter, DctQ subunit [Desulfotomaculum arcticum] [Desulfotruncus arcticus DSM 17038]
MGNLDKVMTSVEETINGSLLLLATAVLFVNVILRYVFHNSTTWAEEAIRYSIVWVTFFGGSMCARNKMHVGIDIFVQMAPPLIRKILMILAQLSAAFFTAMITYFGWVSTHLVIESAQKSPAMMMPIWIVYIAMPLGSALMTIRFLAAAYAILKDKTFGVEMVEKNGSVDISRL